VAQAAGYLVGKAERFDQLFQFLSNGGAFFVVIDGDARVLEKFLHCR
jgi:hypothetical protein